MQILSLVVLFIVWAGGEQLEFPTYFKFGTATASYQVEGGWDANGKGENIWDHLTHQHPDWILDHENGDVACDSYHHWKDDVSNLKKLGVHFYRFSLSWSRLLPTGFSNIINPDGIRYYNALINELLANKIEPMVTLYHWDLPQPLQDIGGWPNEVLAEIYKEYANVAFRYFGDRVKTWITFNEPIEVCLSGYEEGNNAPAYRSQGVGSYLCGKTLLLAHAKAYRLYEYVYKAKQKGKVGITINSIWAEPKTNNSADVDAAERHLQMEFGWWANPIFSQHGDYPQIMKKRIANISKLENYHSSRLPEFTVDEILLIKGSADFLGLNHYTTALLSVNEYPINAPSSFIKDKGVQTETDPSWPTSMVPWLRVVPWGFRKLLNWIKNTYNNPLVYVTENGYCETEMKYDRRRVEYHRLYLDVLLQAIYYDKCNVSAYSAWSLMDNMEWRAGYFLKFGLFSVNFLESARTRTAKLSAYFYSTIIKSRKTTEFPSLIITQYYNYKLFASHNLTTE